jgi:hypothetical protein
VALNAHIHHSPYPSLVRSFVHSFIVLWLLPCCSSSTSTVQVSECVASVVSAMAPALYSGEQAVVCAGGLKCLSAIVAASPDNVRSIVDSGVVHSVAMMARDIMNTAGTAQVAKSLLSSITSAGALLLTCSLCSN